MSDIGAAEVVRRGRFSWDVVTRYPDAFDMCLSQPYMFRWMAVRHAKRKVAGGRPATVVARFEPPSAGDRRD